MERLTLRTMEAAQRFPMELADDTPRRPSGQGGFCTECGSPMRRIVVTTFPDGPGGVAQVWRDYPIAIDMFACATMQHLVYVFLSVDEVTQLGEEGRAAAMHGDLDLAEMCFRRIAASWSAYSTARVNLGSVYLDRIKAEQQGAADVTEIRALADEAIHQFARALATSPPSPPQVRLMLARLYVRTERGEVARAHLEPYVNDPSVPEPLKAQARELLAELQQRDAAVSPPATNLRAAPAAGPRFDHPCVSITMPAGWRLAPDPPGDVYARFLGADDELVDVVLAHKPYDPYGDPPSRLVSEIADGYAQVLSGLYKRAVSPEPTTGPIAFDPHSTSTRRGRTAAARCGASSRASR